jgi:hypothetical protein
MACTEGVTKAYVSKLVTPDLHASALGILGALTGLAQIVASLSAGVIWDQFGSTPALLFSCVGAFLFFASLLFIKLR